MSGFITIYYAIAWSLSSDSKEKDPEIGSATEPRDLKSVTEKVNKHGPEEMTSDITEQVPLAEQTQWYLKHYFMDNTDFLLGGY